MIQVHEGQCGLCTHFGEHHQANSTLVQIRRTKQAPEDFVDDCGHPKHASLNLHVTPMAGCDAFELAPTAA